MSKIKNITYITYGDSNDPKTWSNVAYLFGKELEKEHKVNRVNIGHKRDIISIAVTLYFKIFHRNSTYYYGKSKLNYKRVNRLLKKIVEKYDDHTDLYIINQYNYNLKRFTSKKILLFSDWPIDYYIEKRLLRKPDKYELMDIVHYKETIKEADYVVTLLNDCKKWIDEKYDVTSYYLGNVINCFKNSSEFNNEKRERNYISYIGKITYIDSCVELIKAFNSLMRTDYELHIVGLYYKNFDTEIKRIVDGNKNIVIHGFLDKGNIKQCNEYYDIIKKSLVIVNTHPLWGGLSSILECMYCYRPIITSRYHDFENLFGSQISFGYYCDNNSADIIKQLKKIISLSDDIYMQLSKKSNFLTQDLSYSNYIKKIERLVQYRK